MTKDEALKLLEDAPQGDGPSKINPGYSQAEVVAIVKDGLPEGKLSRLFEKRVWQAVRNQKRPRF